MLALRLVYRERAIPLAWVCYRPGEAPAPFPTLIDGLITEVAVLVPPGTSVILMTDRGLAWPSLVDQCRRVGWSFLLRVQGQTRVRTPDGHTQAIGDLAPRPGTRWQGRGCAFQDAGWRDVKEASFRDDKASGFDWDASRVRDPTHMEPLLLVLQLAAGFVLVQGTFVLQHGLRRTLERQDRRTLSIFSVGLRWLDRARSHFVPLFPRLLFAFP